MERVCGCVLAAPKYSLPEQHHSLLRPGCMLLSLALPTEIAQGSWLWDLRVLMWMGCRLPATEESQEKSIRMGALVGVRGPSPFGRK